MRYLLAAINAKYIHSNLGICSLRRYAMERLGLRPRLVEGREDNFKVTTPADLARFAFELSRRA